MNSETKRLALVATILFFPAGLVGWWLYNKSAERALMLFRLSVYIFLCAISIAGFVVLVFGGRWIEVIASFF